MAHKRTIKGKEYVYDYAQIYIDRKSHIRLRKTAMRNHKTTSKMIDFLIDFYEDNI